MAGTVVVATIRSIKHNAGVPKQELAVENLDALRSGIVNLQRHVENLRKFGVTPVVALNRFSTDTDAEREYLRSWAEDCGVALTEADVWARGGAGAEELAALVLQNLHAGKSAPLYDPRDGIENAIATLARELYRAENVQYSVAALRDLKMLKANGFDTLPVCVSKTQYSFSDDPGLLGAPVGHTLHVRKLIPRTGAGFVVALTGDVMTMPGLPKEPAANHIDIDETGSVTGLF